MSYDQPKFDEPKFNEDLFQPGFSKDYEVHGNRFTVEVQYLGFLHRSFSKQQHTWMFRISVNGHSVVTGPFHNGWDRELTDENVANNLATFWGTSEAVKQAQNFPGTVEYQLDSLVQACANWMHKFYLRDQGHTDFDIVAKHLATDNGEWTIILRPNYIKNRILEFYRPDQNSKIEIHSYVEDNELSIEF